MSICDEQIQVTKSRRQTSRRGFLHWIANVHDHWQQRRTLLQLNKTLLDDIGLTDQDVADELRRSVWDVTANWRK